MANAETLFNRCFVPDEPRSIQADIPRLERAKFCAKVWATRRRPWVDRLASAWLIRRFIDPEAHFVWLAHPSQCPVGALGFDFDGADFTHVGEKVTFEVLIASFGLEQDMGLQRMAALVHYLDVGGAPVAEAVGLKLMLAGARSAVTTMMSCCSTQIACLTTSIRGIWRGVQVKLTLAAQWQWVCLLLDIASGLSTPPDHWVVCYQSMNIKEAQQS